MQRYVASGSSSALGPSDSCALCVPAFGGRDAPPARDRATDKRTHLRNDCRDNKAAKQSIKMISELQELIIKSVPLKQW